MKHGTLLLAILAASRAFAAEPNQWEGKTVPTLILPDGRKFADVTFQKIEPASITIKHDGGVAEIPAHQQSLQNRA